MSDSQFNGAKRYKTITKRQQEVNSCYVKKMLLAKVLPYCTMTRCKLCIVFFDPNVNLPHVLYINCYFQQHHFLKYKSIPLYDEGVPREMWKVSITGVPLCCIDIMNIDAYPM